MDLLKQNLGSFASVVSPVRPFLESDDHPISPAFNSLNSSARSAYIHDPLTRSLFFEMFIKAVPFFIVPLYTRT